MFDALARGVVPTGGLRFTHILQDIQTLNERVRRGDLDISAISFASYPEVVRDYALLPCGASMGDGYGPRLVSLQPRKPSDLEGLRIAIPGKLTSAFLALRLYLAEGCSPQASGVGFPPSAPRGVFRASNFVEVPFDRIFDALREGKADVGLIIHEGQLTYAKAGFHLIEDLGAWWKCGTGLPLPLGGNVIRKALGADVIRAAAAALSASIRHGLDHLEEALPRLRGYARDMTDDLTRTFVKMYVNGYTVDYGEAGRRAIREFLSRGAAAGFIPAVEKIEFVGE
ncbi:MAG: ABC transporter substrate-binding protein [Verrucomicrobiae bacterium]|nr:ABC transporter substrate-binding protein [Verrucomicrobiae bacterium]